MDLGIKNKIAIVCASSQGLGKATAMELAKEGAKVVILARHKKDVDETAHEISSATDSEVLPLIADVTKAEDIQKVVKTTVEKFGTVHILVNNAGGPPVANFAELSDDMWTNGVNLTLMSLIRMTREVLPHMLKNKWGRIINITSLTAKQPINDLIISSTLRPGILGLAKILSNQYSKFGILVNNVCPGHYLTKRQEEIIKKRSAERNITAEEYIAQHSSEIPVGRFGKPEELANMIVFLCSEKASYVTGSTISVDGGLVKGLF
jgi:3-oxoacyl-[acyl-carrier protein] reductase